MTLRLEDMSWPDIESELQAGTRLVVVMTASIEQHGPGLPLAVDAIRSDELGERIADELGCFLAPTIRPGLSDHHMSFPGTISLRSETFEAVVRDYCRSLDSHGFEHVALVTTHGGNTAALQEAAAEADDELDAHVFVAGDRESFLDVRYGAMQRHGVDALDAGKHAGAAETSFLLETRPDLVEPSELRQGFVGEIEGDIEPLETYSEWGVLGDQTKATRGAGRTLIDDCVEYYADAITAQLNE